MQVVFEVKGDHLLSTYIPQVGKGVDSAILPRIL